MQNVGRNVDGEVGTSSSVDSAGNLVVGARCGVIEEILGLRADLAGGWSSPIVALGNTMSLWSRAGDCRHGQRKDGEDGKFHIGDGWFESESLVMMMSE